MKKVRVILVCAAALIGVGSALAGGRAIGEVYVDKQPRQYKKISAAQFHAGDCIPDENSRYCYYEIATTRAIPLTLTQSQLNNLIVSGDLIPREPFKRFTSHKLK